MDVNRIKPPVQLELWPHSLLATLNLHDDIHLISHCYRNLNNGANVLTVDAFTVQQ